MNIYIHAVGHVFAAPTANDEAQISIKTHHPSAQTQFQELFDWVKMC